MRTFRVAVLHTYSSPESPNLCWKIKIRPIGHRKTGQCMVLLLLVVGVVSLYNSICYKNNFSNKGMGLFSKVDIIIIGRLW